MKKTKVKTRHSYRANSNILFMLPLFQPCYPYANLRILLASLTALASYLAPQLSAIGLLSVEYASNSQMLREREKHHLKKVKI